MNTPLREHRPATRFDFTKEPADVLDHVTSEIAIDSKPGIDATRKLPGERFMRPRPPLIKMDEAVKTKVEKLF